MATGVIRATDVSDGIIEILAMEALLSLTENLKALELCKKASDLDPEATREKGDTINVFVPGSFTAQDKTDGNDYTFQRPSSTQVQISVNKHKEVSFRLSNKSKTFSKLQLVKQFGAEAGIALAKKADTDILAEYANAGSSVGAFDNGALAKADFQSLMTAMDNAEVSEDNRFVCLHTAVYPDVLAISEFTEAAKIGNDTQALRKGVVGEVFGFNVVKDPRVYSTEVSSANRYSNLAWQYDCLVYAPVLPELPDEPNVMAAIASIADDEGNPTGFSVLVTRSYNHNKGASQITYEILYGTKVLRSDGVIEVKRSAAA